jgi:hypothetical protein
MMSSAGGGQATLPPPPSPPLTPPPPTDNSDTDEFDDENDVIDAAMNAKFMDDAEHEAEEERAALAAFNAEKQYRREAPAVE